MRALVKPILACLLGALLLSCSANPRPGILPQLLAGKPVCLAMDWGSGPTPNFFGWTAPDTMLLLPGGGEDLGLADSTGAEGRVAMARSQSDRKGGGWIWWTQHDTLLVRSMSPTMDDLTVLAIRPGGSVAADWRGSGFATSERGQVGLQPYECRTLPQSPSSIVPAEAPDSVPSWARADSSFVGPSRYIPLRFIRNVVGVKFRKEATQSERVNRRSISCPERS